MKKIIAIVIKELMTFFKSPMAYIILVITTCVFNYFFYLIIDFNREATLRDIFKLMEFLFVFLVPLLTMKVFSEEKADGTMEFLMTTPTTNTAIVIGKYLGCLIFYTLIILFTCSYYFIIDYYGDLDRAAAWTGYLGIWLEGALFIAIGLLTSSLTKNQIIAAISSYIIIFILYFSISFVAYTSGRIELVIRYFNTIAHLENFASGLLTLPGFVYYLSGIIFCLLLTRLSIETRI